MHDTTESPHNWSASLAALIIGLVMSSMSLMHKQSMYGMLIAGSLSASRTKSWDQGKSDTKVGSI